MVARQLPWHSVVVSSVIWMAAVCLHANMCDNVCMP